MERLEAAISYEKRGFSVIPVKKDKRPFVKWEPYQKERAPETLIREWWAKYPGANIGIVTGKISGLTVLDADSTEGKNAIEEFLPDSLVVPIVKTPKGWHYYFNHAEGLQTGTRILNDCDIRNDGGYVVAPPSKNGSSVPYQWEQKLHEKNHFFPEIPQVLFDIIKQQSFNTNTIIKDISSTLDPLVYAQIKTTPDDTMTTLDDSLSKGSRDNTLFHLANHLVKGGMPVDNIRFFLRFFASHCNPPFPEKEIEIKIQSAISRSNKRDSNLAAEVREFVLSSSGVFLSSECHQVSSVSSRDGRKAVSKILSRLVDEGIIERVGGKNGQFRRIESDLNVMDIFNVKSEYLDIHYPLGLENLFKTMPKNIILIAGTQNVGKTAYLMNLAALNMNRGLEIRYFTSEMGELELVERCKMFEPGIPFNFWKSVQFCDHNTGFKDKLAPDGINIIDYLEISDAFYKVAEILTGIHERLEKGIAVIALQKGINQELGRGAEFSLEKPRLYITMSKMDKDDTEKMFPGKNKEANIAKIVKCKNWKRSDINPNGMECIFNVVHGTKIHKALGWYKP